jgi:glycosyltransferase involved in cell wall biosynthesis
LAIHLLSIIPCIVHADGLSNFMSYMAGTIRKKGLNGAVRRLAATGYFYKPIYLRTKTMGRLKAIAVKGCLRYAILLKKTGGLGTVAFLAVKLLTYNPKDMLKAIEESIRGKNGSCSASDVLMVIEKKGRGSYSPHLTVVDKIVRDFLDFGIGATILAVEDRGMLHIVDGRDLVDRTERVKVVDVRESRGNAYAYLAGNASRHSFIYILSTPATLFLVGDCLSRLSGSMKILHFPKLSARRTAIAGKTRAWERVRLDDLAQLEFAAAEKADICLAADDRDRATLLEHSPAKIFTVAPACSADAPPFPSWECLFREVVELSIYSDRKRARKQLALARENTSHLAWSDSPEVFVILLRRSCDSGEVGIGALAQAFSGCGRRLRYSTASSIKEIREAFASSESGRILFLSDEFLVAKGGVDSLAAALDAATGAIMCGGLVIGEHAKLESAGYALGSDGGFWSCGQGENFFDSEYLHPRETSFPAPEFMLLDKNRLRRIVDALPEGETLAESIALLSIQANRHGRYSWIEPAARAFNTGSPLPMSGIVPGFAGREPAEPRFLPLSGAERREREARLERHCRPEAEGRRGGKRLNLLYYSPVPSHPANHGNRSTINNFASLFQQFGHRVHFALPADEWSYGPDDVAAMRAKWDRLHILSPCPGKESNGEDFPFDSWYRDELGVEVRRICLKEDIDVVFCSYVFQSRLLDLVPDHVLKIIDTHDKMSDRFALLKARGLPLEFFSCSREDEARYLRRADLVVARRREEADFFDSITRRANAVVLSHVEPPSPIGKGFLGLANVGMLASMNVINFGIVRDFLAAFDRRLGKRNSPVAINIAGQVCDMIPKFARRDIGLFQRPYVKLWGFVQSVQDFYESMDLIVSPVMVGTGINVKTVQAMAYGLPLLATECGIKGIETGNPHHCHRTLDDLVDDLLSLPGNPGELEALAELSRRRYVKFHSVNMDNFRNLFNHDKLKVG